MRERTLAVLKVLLLFSVIFVIVGEKANGREPGLPDELMQVKTLCLDLSGAEVPIYEENAEKENSKLEEATSEAIKKEGRFAVVPNCGSADGVLRVSNRRASPTLSDDRFGIRTTYVARPLEFSIVGQRYQQTLYRTVTPNCQNVSNCIKAEIKTLSKKMAKQEKLAISLPIADCGAARTPARTPVGILVQSTPANQTAYSGQSPPKNQVSFAAYIRYSDGTFGSTPISGAQWSKGDGWAGDTWISLHGSVATCLKPAPVVNLAPFFSTVTATAKVNGNTYTASSGLNCL